jgi:hypothetical protein
MPNDVWIKDWPLSTTTPSACTEELTGNWNCLEKWWDIEHDTLTSASPGLHTSTKVAAVLTAASADILALADCGTGAMAYDIEHGQLQTYSVSGWRGITQDYWSRSRTILMSAALPTATWTRLIGGSTDTDQFDTLTEVVTGTGRATMRGTGRYFVAGTVRFPATSLNYIKAVSLYVNGTQQAIYQTYGSQSRNLEVYDILSLNAGDYVEVWCYHSSATGITAVGGSLNFSKIS